MNGELRCPTCRAAVRAAECARCGTDLADLIRIEQRARELTEKARLFLLEGDSAAAAAAAEAAMKLRATDAARSMRILGLLGSGRYTEALRVHQEKKDLADPRPRG